jgi:hypothetical protein
MADRRLLAVFAHPDDETFRCGGTLALPLKERKRIEASLPRQRGSVPDHRNKSISEGCSAKPYKNYTVGHFGKVRSAK